MKNKYIAVMLMGVLVLALAGCSRGEKIYGEPVTEQTVTPISAILADSKGFKGKTILIDGKISLECPTGCWFDVTDATGTIYVDIASGGGFSIPQKTGSKVLVQGVVDVGESGLPILLGTGVEF